MRKWIFWIIAVWAMALGTALAATPVASVAKAELEAKGAQTEGCHILSLNNSLIDFNNQPDLFNQIASSMGKKANWEARTQLGKTLIYHYNNATSRQAALNGKWDYIILQEQSSLPRTHPEVMLQCVELWWRALDDKFGAQAPTIVLPMNWGYSDADSTTFAAQTKQLVRSYLDAERDVPGVQVCPVGIAYEIVYNDHGRDQWLSLYTDRMHPTLKASYLAACMEYALIFGEDPEAIAYCPDGLSAADAQLMRAVAAKALARWRAAKMVSR